MSDDGNHPALKRANKGVPVLVTAFFESLGVLNKGTAALSKGTLTEEEAAEKAPVTTPSFNVTRVGGFAALIASAGAATLALYNIDATTNTMIVATAYASTGFVVAASLITAAVIISADIRARSSATMATGASTAAKSIATDAEPTSPADFKDAWKEALDRLQNIKNGLPDLQDRNDYSGAWLAAEASKGFTRRLQPGTVLADEHELLSRGQEEVCDLLYALRLSTSTAEDQSEIRFIIEHMQSVVNNIHAT